MNDTGEVDDIGVTAVKLILSKQKFIFREQCKRDYGIDAHIEIKGLDYPSGNLIGIQIKSGPSYFKEVDKNNNVIFRSNSLKHYDYWLSHCLPIILVLYNTDDEECIWVHINDKSTKKLKRNFKVTIPRKNKLKSCSTAINKIIANQSEYERKFSQLLFAKPLMKHLAAGNQVVIEAEDWINKTLGRGYLDISIYDKNNTELDMLHWGYFSSGSFEDMLTVNFPWAHIKLDDDYYYDEEAIRYKEDNCPYDKEDGEYLFYDYDEFHRWREKLPSIRPYSSNGEAEYYRLELTLNYLGESFLNLDNYLENGPEKIEKKKEEISEKNPEDFF